MVKNEKKSTNFYFAIYRNVSRSSVVLNEKTHNKRS